ncbi:hypothetical protein SAMN02910370_00621 [Lachnospiraceae bacterium XPB1003]|nr:hypothetical protein SAMN02910370_00621 [Lachnospiraceae bacterium XPB1003]
MQVQRLIQRYTLPRQRHAYAYISYHELRLITLISHSLRAAHGSSASGGVSARLRVIKKGNICRTVAGDLQQRMLAVCFLSANDRYIMHVQRLILRYTSFRQRHAYAYISYHELRLITLISHSLRAAHGSSASGGVSARLRVIKKGNICRTVAGDLQAHFRRCERPLASD